MINTDDTAVIELGAASVETKGAIQGFGESVGKQLPLGLSAD